MRLTAISFAFRLKARKLVLIYGGMPKTWYPFSSQNPESAFYKGEVMSAQVDEEGIYKWI